MYPVSTDQLLLVLSSMYSVGQMKEEHVQNFTIEVMVVVAQIARQMSVIANKMKSGNICHQKQAFMKYKHTITQRTINYLIISSNLMNTITVFVQLGYINCACFSLTGW